ncbi:unnamed protein product [Dibothriocephalus latus]|uniref:Uncharacterized protein n=1 Tax=Dibothriocephalus latus TaxID=60516 RepID=A0A3P7P4C8_DIBLA|nr:unnamed protein product [Dibothriocephalus latus]
MSEVKAGTMTDSAIVSFASLTDSQSACSSRLPKKSPRMTGEATIRRHPTVGEWKFCPEYRRPGVCSAMPEEKNGCVVDCQLAHIKPEDAVSVTA